MTLQYNRIAFRKALEKSLESLGESSKKSLLLYLEKDFHISLTQGTAPRMEDLEAALKSILGRGAYIITDEIHKNLELQDTHTPKRGSSQANRTKDPRSRISKISN
jgi:hypothetical protein